MGFTLPSPTSPAEQVRALMARKEGLEAELQSQLSILKTNTSTLNSPLVDPEGFPRADIDIYAVRGARIRILELKNDLKDVMDEIGKALELVYHPTSDSALPGAPEPGTALVNPETSPSPFAKVDGVAPCSPAAEAGLQRDDLIVKFGHLTRQSFTSSSLSPLADLVAGSENRVLPIKVLRGSDQTVVLGLTPRSTWGGRGMLGCHIIPYSIPP